MVLSPYESSEYIVKNADHIKINEIGIENLKNEIIQCVKNGSLNTGNFSQNDHHPSENDDYAINWIFVVDTLNFCFWTPDDAHKWKVNGNTGYFALCASINRAIKEGIPILDPNYYQNITREQLLHIFRSDDDNDDDNDKKIIIPLIDERQKCLHEAGKKLLEKFNGNFEICIKSCENSAKKLLNLIITEFSCYRDEAIYKGENVSFYKRAQILIGDIWSCFNGKGIGKFDDINTTITMFADYRVPQVLYHFNALQYSDELLKRLNNNEILKNGDYMEIEIRGASIYIVELIKKRILKELENLKNSDNNCVDSKNLISKIDLDKINSILIDHFLWDYRRKHANELQHIPFHKVLCIYY